MQYLRKACLGSNLGSNTCCLDISRAIDKFKASVGPRVSEPEKLLSGSEKPLLSGTFLNKTTNAKRLLVFSRISLIPFYAEEHAVDYNVKLSSRSLASTCDLCPPWKIALCKYLPASHEPNWCPSGGHESSLCFLRAKPLQHLCNIFWHTLSCPVLSCLVLFVLFSLSVFLALCRFVFLSLCLSVCFSVSLFLICFGTYVTSLTFRMFFAIESWQTLAVCYAEAKTLLLLRLYHGRYVIQRSKLQ